MTKVGNSFNFELHSERIPRSLLERSGNPALRGCGVSERIKKLMEFLDELFRQGIASRLLPTRLPVISLEIKPVEGENPFILISNGKRILMEAVHCVNSME